MAPRDVFGIIVRTLGLMWTIYGLYLGIGFVNPAAGYTRADYLGGMIGLTLIGLALLFGADLIAGATYRRRTE